MAQLLQALALAPAVSRKKVLYNRQCVGSIFPFGVAGGTTLITQTGEIKVSSIWAGMGITVGANEILEGSVSITMPSFIPELSLHISEAPIPIRAVMTGEAVHYYEPIIQVGLSGGKPQLSSTIDTVVADSIIITPTRSAVEGQLSVRSGVIGNPIDISSIGVNNVAFDFTIKDLYEGNVNSEIPDIEWILQNGLVYPLGIASNARRQMKGSKASSRIQISNKLIKWSVSYKDTVAYETAALTSRSVVYMSIVTTYNGELRTDDMQKLLNNSEYTAGILRDPNYPSETLVKYDVILSEFSDAQYQLSQALITHSSVMRLPSLGRTYLNLTPPQDESSANSYFTLEKEHDSDLMSIEMIDLNGVMGQRMLLPHISGDISSKIRSTFHYPISRPNQKILLNANLSEILVYSPDLTVNNYEIMIFDSDANPVDTPKIRIQSMAKEECHPSWVAGSMFTELNQAYKITSCYRTTLASCLTEYDQPLPGLGWLLNNQAIGYLVEPGTITLDSDPSTTGYSVVPNNIMVSP